VNFLSGCEVLLADDRAGIESLLGPVFATPVSDPDPSNPLTARREVAAHGEGMLAGKTVGVVHPVALRPPAGAEVLARVGADPVAFTLEVDGRAVVVVGAGQACALSELFVDRVAPGAHPLPLVVDADGFSAVPPPELLSSDPGFLTAAGHAGRLLGPTVHDALVDFADDPNPAGALLIRGLPVGQVPATPATPSTPTGKDTVSEFTLLCAARRLGGPVGYAPEHGGDLVQNIVPTQAGAQRQMSTSSLVGLEFHTEAAFHPYRPRYLALLCLRGDPAAFTTLCSVRHLALVVDPEVLAVLRQARFTTSVDESYLGGRRSQRRSTPAAVVAGRPGRERFWFDGDLMRGVDREADAALDVVRSALDEHRVEISLSAGDLLVLDNDLVVHGRSPFTPRFDGTDRWLQRSFVLGDPSACVDLTGRIVATRFLE
jgi:L-asparagine oxygenase